MLDFSREHALLSTIWQRGPRGLEKGSRAERFFRVRLSRWHSLLVPQKAVLLNRADTFSLRLGTMGSGLPLLPMTYRLRALD